VSEIVGFVGLSHSPFAGLLPPGPDGPGAGFLADVARAREAVAALAPDALHFAIQGVGHGVSPLGISAFSAAALASGPRARRRIERCARGGGIMCQIPRPW